jgi:predicted permease
VTDLLTRLLGLFPAAFREQFGPDMAEQIRIDHTHAAAAGRLQATAMSLTTLFDLLLSAVAERMNPSWPDRSAPSFEGRGRNEMIGSFLQDLRLALRALRREPGFALVAIGTLGLAIGANAAIFAAVDAVLLEPLPYVDQDRLVYIAASAPGSDLPDEFGLSAEFFVHYREEATLLEDGAAYVWFTNTLRADERAERVWMSMATPSLFRTLGATPLHGRFPVPEDESVVVISHALWATWFGSDPSVVGRNVDIGVGPHTIIGITEPGFWFPNDQVLLWISNPVEPEGITPGRFGTPMIARMAPGIDHETLTDQLAVLARQLPERFGGSASYARIIEQHNPVVRSLHEELLGTVSGPLWVLLGAVAVVLLIACANVANLFGVRAERRQRDIAVRRALGAGRGQLARAQMAEALLVAACAGVLAVLLAWVGVPVFLSAAPGDVPRLDQAGMTATTLLFTFVVALLSSLLFGLVPALRASAPNPNRLREGERGSTGQRHWLRDGLVVAQTALALVLLIGSALLVRSFAQLRDVDPGYDTEGVLTFQLAPESDSLTDGPSYARFHLDFMNRLAAMPGVESVGIVENVPLNEGLDSQRFLTEETAADVEGGALLRYTYAAGDYYRTMGIEVLRGRPFTRADHVSQPGNVVISESAAELLWPGEDPIGRRLTMRDSEHWETVVGVVEDVMQDTFRDTPEPLVYFPLVGQTPDRWMLPSPAYVVKTARTEAIVPEIRALVGELAPGAPMYRVFTMDGLAADSMVQLSFTMLTLAVAAGLALVLGAIGLYGVLSYVVAGRTREIGVRMALGAQAAGVRRMVVAQGARVVGLGVLIGVAAALATTRVLANLLYGVGGTDVATFLAMAMGMFGIGLLASYVPARRASSVDPVESLRDA